MLPPDVLPTDGATTETAARRGAPTRRRTASPVVLLLAVGLLGLAGCGGGDDDDGTEPGDGGSVLTAADARAADATVKDGVREIADAIESCFVGARDYRTCARPDRIGPTELDVVPDAPGVSQARVSRATATGYRVLAVSLSGNRFAITRQGGQVIRSCAARTEVGKDGGGCRGNGW